MAPLQHYAGWTFEGAPLWMGITAVANCTVDQTGFILTGITWTELCQFLTGLGDLKHKNTQWQRAVCPLLGGEDQEKLNHLK